MKPRAILWALIPVSPSTVGAPTPATDLASTAFVVVVNAALPIRSTADLIAYAKARPGEVLYGSSGQRGSTHRWGKLLHNAGARNAQ